MLTNYNLKSHIGKSGRLSWKSPSNLALVKYWGKYGRQFPRNPSLSFTLNNAFTETTVRYEVKEHASEEIDLAFKFEGEKKPAFANKIKKYFHSILDIYPFLNQLKFEISSSNSFPHSSGIASSASSMSALALCLVSLEKEIFDVAYDSSTFLAKASNLARLGSGSASRSVFPNLGMWGKFEDEPLSSQEYAIPYFEDFDPIFLSFHDDILIVSENEKSVSSTAGHQLMENNIYSENRYQQANNRLKTLIASMKTGDLESFGKIVEDEALTLHALMMCSEPSYILMEPQTITLIKKIRAFRAQNNLPVFFSLDAGPNIHLLYPHHVHSEINSFIKEQLSDDCIRVIEDQVGKGPVQLFKN